MLYRKNASIIIILILSMAGLLQAQQDFPICGYHAKNEPYYDVAPQVVNRIEIEGPYDWTVQQVLNKLDVADDYGLKVAFRAAKSSPGYGTCLLEWYTRQFWTNWEVDSSIFQSNIGSRVIDFWAQDWDAWKVSYTIHPPGYLVNGPTYATKSRDVAALRCTLLLKINQPTDAPVCSFIVWDRDPNPDVKIGAFQIDGDDFNVINQYQKFPFTINQNGNAKINYQMYWFGLVDLWIDYIETKSPYIEALLNGNYDSQIQTIAEIYDDHNALEYYYLVDEPDVGNYAACRYVMDKMDLWGYKPQLQTQCYFYPGIYKTYDDSVKPNILLTNLYPFRHGEAQSGPEFQNRLNWMMNIFMEARKAAKGCNLPFGCVLQTHGTYTTDYGGFPTGPYRLPSYNELRCNIWLALAIGAKSVWYYLYETLGSGNYYECGLIHMDGVPREPIWTAAKDMKNILVNPLNGIGNTLLNLESDTAFYNLDGIPENCYIFYVNSDDTVHIGTFHDMLPEDDYFIIVNRRCSYLIPITCYVQIGINRYNIYLKDVYTGELIYPDIGPDPRYFTIDLELGEGRLFQIMNVFKSNGSQSLGTISHDNLHMTAYPTLFKDQIKIELTGLNEMQIDDDARVVICNAVGQVIRRFSSLSHSLIWDRKDDEQKTVPPGIYFVQLKTSTIKEVKKIVLVK